jgi:hypothetical protein
VYLSDLVADILKVGHSRLSESTVMKIEDLNALASGTPLRPFVIEVANGQSFEINSQPHLFLPR